MFRPFTVSTAAGTLCCRFTLTALLYSACGCWSSSAVAPAEFVAPPAASAKLAVSADIPALSPRTINFRNARTEDWFELAEANQEVRFTYRDGSEAAAYQLLETVGGGGACFDFDASGTQDLFFAGGGSLDKSPDSKSIAIRGRIGALFLNGGPARFADVSSAARLDNDGLYSHGCTALDVDGDGFEDLLVAGYHGLQLWWNLGDGTFRDAAAELGLIHDAWNVAAAAADYDRDGLIDIYLLTYADWSPDPERKCLNDQDLHDVCGPTLFPGARDAMFRNTGERYEEVSDQVGLVAKNRGLGVLAADVDHNGFVDFVVVNDVEENQLYLNNAGVPFREEGVLRGIAYSDTGEREGSMGIDLGDFNQDGFADLWYTNYAQQDNSLMRNVDGTGFVHSAKLVGLTGVSRPWVGFGTLLTDLDGDGWDDIFVANGHVAYERRDSPYFQPPQLFRNDHGERFVEVSRSGGPYFDLTWSARGAWKTDVNEDGAWDLVIVHQNEPAAILRNRQAPPVWIKIHLVGTTSDRNAIGAVAAIRQGDRILKRWKVGGGSYASHSDPRLLWALEEDSAVDVTVNWLGGQIEIFSSLQPNETHVLVEGRGQHAVP